ncbi:hypothetical protein ABIE67_009672 [Streptomyces sp. V4I8]
MPVDPASVSVETGLADVVTLQRRRQARMSAYDEESFFLDTLSEYQWARDAAGLAPTTLDGLIKPVIEVCEYYGTVPWQLTPREVDKYFAGPGKRAQSTVRGKINKIDAYFAFLEQRYAGEVMRRFGGTVESPIAPFNRPRHRGDFGLRIPPSQAAMKEPFQLGSRSGDGWEDETGGAPGQLSEVLDVSTLQPGGSVGYVSCRTGPAARTRGDGHDADRPPGG